LSFALTKSAELLYRTVKKQSRIMNSRERILAAIEHHQPDKVPVDLGSTPSSGISAIWSTRTTPEAVLDKTVKNPS